MTPGNYGKSEYKVVIWDEDEMSTTTIFRGARAYHRASEHFNAAQDHPAAREAWFLFRSGERWQLVAPPTEQAMERDG